MARAALIGDAAVVIGDVDPHDGDGTRVLQQMRASLADAEVETAGRQSVGRQSVTARRQ
ncbi:hypothetical protein [Euzebya pacifica]|jgi:hypothetical protein|uniref:hypothetical protein n=1 Tax=Euzebya pacifica TaxID=1608957 RepID=UPI0030F5A0A3